MNPEIEERAAVASEEPAHTPSQALPALALAALGIVFGDIATSPLYALQEAFGAHAMLLIVDLAFLGANLMKIGSGGWFPLVLGLVVFVVMATWQRGRDLLSAQLREQGVPLEPTIASLVAHPPTRVQGTAVFLTTSPDQVPQSLLHNIKHNQVLHERNAIVTVELLDVPHATSDQRVRVESLGDGFYRIAARFGFAESPDVPRALQACAAHGLEFELDRTTFFTSRENLVAGERSGMSIWRDRLFVFMARNAMPANAFFRVPDNRLIELGRRVVI